MKDKLPVDYPRAYLYRRIVQAKLFIDKHYADAIDLDVTANEACFSKFHFIRIFKKLYRNTPHQYLIQVRIIRAKQLLLTEPDVATVCFLVGFDSVTTFTSLFKKVVTQTPAQYQAMQQARKLEVSKSPLKFIPNCFAESNGFKNSNFQ